jgi:hypothetical protein
MLRRGRQHQIGPRRESAQGERALHLGMLIAR